MKYYKSFKVVGYMINVISYDYFDGVWENRFLLLLKTIRQFYIGQLSIRGKCCSSLPKIIQDRLKRQMAAGKFHTISFYCNEKEQEVQESYDNIRFSLKDDNFILVDERLRDCDFSLLQDNIKEVIDSG